MKQGEKSISENNMECVQRDEYHTCNQVLWLQLTSSTEVTRAHIPWEAAKNINLKVNRMKDGHHLITMICKHH